MSVTTDEVPAVTDVFIHSGAGLTPSCLNFIGDDDSGVILRFTQPRAEEARFMVSVEFDVEHNEVVGNVYESQVRYAAESRDVHLDGSVQATVSRLLRELAAMVAGDRRF